MPGRPGAGRGVPTGLTIAQRQYLTQLIDTHGFAEGYKNLYRRQRRHFQLLGQDYASRDEVLAFLRPMPGYQIHNQATPKPLTTMPLIPPRIDGEAKPSDWLRFDFTITKRSI